MVQNKAIMREEKVMGFIVTEKAQRPARMNGRCFYCCQPIGAEHKDDCVLISKKIKIQMTVEYEIKVPAEFNGNQIEFSRNEGTWCCDNAIQELENLSKENGCLCNIMKFKYLGDESGPYLSE
jgi:hypothetical protein